MVIHFKVSVLVLDTFCVARGKAMSGKSIKLTGYNYGGNES